MAEKKFFINVCGKGDKAIDVTLPNGNLNILKIQELARSETPILFDKDFADVAMEILARYPIGSFPITPSSPEKKSPFAHEPDSFREVLNDLKEELREGPCGG